MLNDPLPFQSEAHDWTF